MYLPVFICVCTQNIFAKCISGLLKNKTRILVTHQPDVLPLVDEIVYMRNGQIEAKVRKGEEEDEEERNEERREKGEKERREGSENGEEKR